MRSLRHFAIPLIVFPAIAIFVTGGYLRAAADDQQAHKKLTQGAKMMMEGNKQARELALKKGIKDPELQQAADKMKKGYNMVTRGADKLTGSTSAEGRSMVTRGANMMVDADRATREAIEKHGKVEEYSRGFSMSANGEKMVGQAFMTYGLQGDWRGVH